jgi:predicted alpha/beta-fold hydrolase
VPDLGSLGLDISPAIVHAAERTDLDDAAPCVIILHGVMGGSREIYVRTLVAAVTAPTDRGGLGGRAVVVNSRGCGGVSMTSRQLFHGALGVSVHGPDLQWDQAATLMTCVGRCCTSDRYSPKLLFSA